MVMIKTPAGRACSARMVWRPAIATMRWAGYLGYYIAMHKASRWKTINTVTHSITRSTRLSLSRQPRPRQLKNWQDQLMRLTASVNLETITMNSTPQDRLLISQMLRETLNTTGMRAGV